MDSILITIRKLLGVESDYDGFDTDIIIAINTAFMSLNQLGVGPTESFSITGADENWDDFIGAYPNIQGVKSYIYLKTRLMFDPPTNSALLESMTRQIDELGWRLNAQAETPPEEV